MLAKVWKKVLLAVCMIACIYNVMHKLVSRTSLEVQLKSVEEKNRTSFIDSDYEKNSLEKIENKAEINTTNNEEDGEDDEEDTIVVIN